MSSTGISKNIEGYYQETGRAGRDGEPANCLLFFGRGDIPKLRYFIDQITDDSERAIVLEKLNQVVGFATHNVCRRKRLLGYFGEVYPGDNCGNCDICAGDAEQIDITRDAQIVMSAISRTQESYGIGHIVDIVTGADTKRIRELQHDLIKTYGAGKDRDKGHWRLIVDELLAQGLIRQEGAPYPVLKLTEKGNNVLFGREQVSALKRDETKVAKRGGFTGEGDRGLFERLRSLRKRTAEEIGVPPFVVFSDKTLHEMCVSYPRTLAEMRKITGVGDAKLKRHGDAFVSEINRYLNEYPGIIPPLAKWGEGGFSGNFSRPRDKKAGETVEETYRLLTKGLSMEEVARQRKLAQSTIASHVEKLILEGRDIDIDNLIEPGKRRRIEEMFLTSKQRGLGAVIDQGDNTVNYEEARLVRAWMGRGKG